MAYFIRVNSLEKYVNIDTKHMKRLGYVGQTHTKMPNQVRQDFFSDMKFILFGYLIRKWFDFQSFWDDVYNGSSEYGFILTQVVGGWSKIKIANHLSPAQAGVADVMYIFVERKPKS